MEPQLPKWMASLDTFTPGRILGVAALLSGINPKNLARNLAAMSVIAAAGPPASEQAVALVVALGVSLIGQGMAALQRERVPGGSYVPEGAHMPPDRSIGR